ncbi:MAG: hypothetical protein SV062_10565 [Thermodesulfobacteriota bacterium]|nr:hypothetical protein [Thermodesulfobacteriota bacterium]
MLCAILSLQINEMGHDVLLTLKEGIKRASDKAFDVDISGCSYA